MVGIIKRLGDGFGFIRPEGMNKEFFFDSSALVDVKFRELHVGDSVSFDIEVDELADSRAND